MDSRTVADQSDEFINLLRNKLARFGLDDEQFDEALLEALEELGDTREATPVFVQGEEPTVENRGMDSLGRILVEYCFFEAQDSQMIWPDHSEQDQAARTEFVANWMPRPVMRYFLASVRGSVLGLDHFPAESIFSLHDDMSHERHIASVDELLKEFKGPFGDGESAIDWEAVYADPRCRLIGLNIIRDIRTRLDQLGLEQYLVILTDLQGKDPEATGVNAMARPLQMEDVRQISDSLAAAESMLADHA